MSIIYLVYGGSEHEGGRVIAGYENKFEALDMVHQLQIHALARPVNDKFPVDMTQEEIDDYDAKWHEWTKANPLSFMGFTDAFDLYYYDKVDVDQSGMRRFPRPWWAWAYPW